MELSICIVSYECRKKLRQCLESLRAYRPPVEHEVIVVDNASTDGTVQMLEDEFYWVQLVANDENHGFSVACNQAVRHATGELLFLLNPDTKILKHSFERLLQFIRKRPWIGAVGPKLVDNDGNVETSCREFPTFTTALRHLFGMPGAFDVMDAFGNYLDDTVETTEPRAVDWLSGAALMLTKKAWDTAGPFDELFFFAAADLDWQKRLQRASLERWYLPSAKIVHHHGRSWQSNADEKAEQVSSFYLAMFRYFKKHHGLATSLTIRALTALTSAVRLPWWALSLLRSGNRRQARQQTKAAWGMLRTAIGFPPGHR